MNIETQLLKNALSAIENIPVMITGIKGKFYTKSLDRVTNKAIYTHSGISKVTYHKYMNEPAKIPLDKAIKLYQSINHFQNHIDAIKSKR